MTKNTNSYSTAIVIIIALNILSVIYSSHSILYVSIFIGLGVILSKKFTSLVHDFWMSLAKLMSYIVPNILLSIIFFFILFPLSIIAKIFRNKDILNIKKHPGSLWITNEINISREYFEKTW